ncbi:MAG: hypothetical protein WCK52_10675 [Betaproteobacteria bacterium]
MANYLVWGTGVFLGLTVEPEADPEESLELVGGYSLFSGSDWVGLAGVGGGAGR